MDDYNILKSAAEKMDLISDEFCGYTECNDSRMKAVDGSDNCHWYHSSWMHLRLAGIVVSEDYLGDYYEQFFRERKQQDVINVLICGMADFATLDHVVRRIPKEMIYKVVITLVDICQSPIELCKWYVETYNIFPVNQLRYVIADATNMPFGNKSFDLITNYSFLTRMVLSEMKKVIDEWHRVLKPKGCIYTTIHINSDPSNVKGAFYRSSSSSVSYAMNKVEEYIIQNKLSLDKAESMRRKCKLYLNNIMSVSIPSESFILSLFKGFNCSFESRDQQGELEAVHKMVLLKAVKLYE